jgi:hypothetical protein
MADLANAELEIPTEYYSALITYLDAKWARHKGDIVGSIALMKEFDRMALDAGIEMQARRGIVPLMKRNF